MREKPCLFWYGFSCIYLALSLRRRIAQSSRCLSAGRCRCGMGVYHQWLQRRRSRGAVGCTPVPRRCRGLTESVTARAVSWQHRDQSGGVGPQRSHGASTRAEVPVRSADPFSVNPGPQSGDGQRSGMHRRAVPLRNECLSSAASAAALTRRSRLHTSPPTMSGVN